MLKYWAPVCLLSPGHDGKDKIGLLSSDISMKFHNCFLLHTILEIEPPILYIPKTRNDIFTVYENFVKRKRKHVDKITSWMLLVQGISLDLFDTLFTTEPPTATLVKKSLAVWVPDDWNAHGGWFILFKCPRWEFNGLLPSRRLN